MMTTMLSLRTCALAVLGPLCLATSALPAQQTLKSVLPEKTLFLATAPDIPAAVEGFKASPWYKIWVEDEVQEFIEDALAVAQEKIEEALGQARAMHEAGMMPVDPDDLLKIRLKAVTFAITDVVIPGPKRAPRVSIVLGLDFGESAEILRGALRTILEMGKQQGGMPPIESKTVGESKLFTLRPPGAEVAFLSLNWGFAGSHLLMGTDTARMTDIMAGLSGNGPGRSLANDETYSDVSKRILAHEATVEVFVRTDAVQDCIMQLAEFAKSQNPMAEQMIDLDGVARALDALGLSAIKGAGMSSGYVDGKGCFKSYVKIPEKERRGLAAIFEAKPVDLEHLAYIPKDAASFSITNMGSPEKVYDAVIKAIHAYSPQFGEMADARIAAFERALGVNIKKDFMGALGPEFITYQMPMQGLFSLPEVVYAFECKNPERTAEVLEKLSDLSEGFVTITPDGEGEDKRYSIGINPPDEVFGGANPLAMFDLTIAFKKGYMILGMSAGDVTSFGKRLAGGAKDDVRSNPAFKPYLASIPNGVSGVGFYDVAATVDGLYSTMSGMLGMLPIPADVPVDLGLLPSVEALTQHLFGNVSYWHCRPDGVHGYAIGPIGPELMIVGAALVGGLGTAALIAAPRQAAAVKRFKEREAVEEEIVEEEVVAEPVAVPARPGAKKGGGKK